MDTLFPMNGNRKRKTNRNYTRNYKEQYIAGTTLPKIDWTYDKRINRGRTAKEVNAELNNDAEPILRKETT